MKVALVDGDSIIYILAWQFRDLPVENETENLEVVCGAVDQMLIGIFQATNATHYLGAIGDSTGAKCFRYAVAKHKPYKGTRSKEPEEWVKRFKPAIMLHLRESWRFISDPILEADDIVSLMAESMWAFKQCISAGLAETPCPYVVCSPDKDLRQIPGTHYDYKKQDFADVDGKQANRNFWMQMLTGDDTDNIAGVPGIGPKKAMEKLDKADQDNMFYEQVVRAEYLKYFDDHYGMEIYGATHACLSLMTTEHMFYDDYMTALMIAVYPVPGATASSVFG